MAANEVKLYNKSTGAFITSIAVTNPRGIAADGSGNAWVACAGAPGSVIQLNFNGTTLSATGKLDCQPAEPLWRRLLRERLHALSLRHRGERRDDRSV